MGSALHHKAFLAGATMLTVFKDERVCDLDTLICTPGPWSHPEHFLGPCHPSFPGRAQAFLGSENQPSNSSFSVSEREAENPMG